MIPGHLPQAWREPRGVLIPDTRLRWRWWWRRDLVLGFPWQWPTIIRGGVSLTSPATSSQTHTFKPSLIFKDLVLKIIDLALEEVDSLVEGEDDVLHGLAINLEITGIVRDHEVIGIESTFHHPLAPEDFLLHSSSLASTDPVPLGPCTSRMWSTRSRIWIAWGCLITHKYRGLQQFSRVEYSTQIYWFDTRGAK